jgi:hypothetical protein
MQKEMSQTTLLLPLRDHHTPLVLLATVHDVANPALDLARDLARGTLCSHGDVDVLTAVVDL